MYTERESPTKEARTAPPARLAVMAVNPHALHTYWQIPDRVLEDIGDRLGEAMAEARPVLRFYDVVNRYGGVSKNQGDLQENVLKSEVTVTGWQIPGPEDQMLLNTPIMNVMTRRKGRPSDT